VRHTSIGVGGASDENIIRGFVTIPICHIGLGVLIIWLRLPASSASAYWHA
jgi:hypothetical protein